MPIRRFSFVASIQAVHGPAFVVASTPEWPRIVADSLVVVLCDIQTFSLLVLRIR